MQIEGRQNQFLRNRCQRDKCVERETDPLPDAPFFYLDPQESGGIPLSTTNKSKKNYVPRRLWMVCPRFSRPTAFFS